MTKYRNRTFYHIAGCLCIVVCESEHATLLWLLVTSPTLVVSSLLTMVVSCCLYWPWGYYNCYCY